MKSQLFNKACMAFIFTLSTTALSAQQISKGFDSKKHTESPLNKSNLQAQVINGKKSDGSYNAATTQNLAQAFKTGTGNLRKDGTKIIISEETGLPLFITSSPNPNARTFPIADKKAACFEYLGSLANYLKLNNPKEDFKIKDIQSDSKGKTHIRLSQNYKGIKVFHSEVMVHLNNQGHGEAFNGRYQKIKKELDVKPAISKQQALTVATQHLSLKTKIRELNAMEKELLEYNAPQVDTILFTLKEPIIQHILAYHITIRPNLKDQYEYFVNAKSAEILQSYQKTCAADGPRTASAIDLNGVSRQISTYQEGTGYILVNANEAMFDPATQEGAIVTVDANKTFGDNFKVQDIISSNNQWLNPAAVSAHFNANVAYNFYKNTYNRNSINGKGGSIISVINVVDEDGSAMDNAYWNGKAMFYGNGNVAFKSLAGGLDVGGHEMTHGVVQNSANLEYQGESGAINESMADIFGFMMDSTDWLLGEDVVNKQLYTSGALRSLQDPHNGGTKLGDPGYQPRHVNEQYKGREDNGGVHINSGIPNHAFYLLATAIGKAKAGLIFYTALTTYLTQNSKFVDLRLAVIQSANELFSNSTAEATQAALAFDGVGITEKVGGVYTPTLPVNPGQEYLLVNNTDPTDENGLYRAVPQISFEPLFGNLVNSKPSITDDGKVCVFVGTDKKIYATNVDPAGISTPTILNNEPIWANVAISKDGNKLAAITADHDTSIYVYDLIKDELAQFILYNPTFSDVRSTGVLYADAIEWDYTGERLIYDAFNKIKNANGDDIEYWDINLINVYDNATKTFGDGTVFKLISGLVEGESIGNPSFSKTSPNIVAFDYVDESDPGNAIYGIIGYNTELNEIGLILQNNTLGFPSYSKNDQKVAFTTLIVGDRNAVYNINLDDDKINSVGEEIALFADVNWPVYFAVGNRDYATGINEEKLGEDVFSVFPNPIKEVANVTLPFSSGSKRELMVYNALGIQVVQLSLHENNGLASIQLPLYDIAAGLYTVVLREGMMVRTTKFIKN